MSNNEATQRKYSSRSTDEACHPLKFLARGRLPPRLPPAGRAGVAGAAGAAGAAGGVVVAAGGVAVVDDDAGTAAGSCWGGAGAAATFCCFGGGAAAASAEPGPAGAPDASSHVPRIGRAGGRSATSRAGGVMILPLSGGPTELPA